jgi:uncharacterized membrane protein YqjE
MAGPSTRTAAIVDLLSAHRELSTVELHEARQNVAAAITWIVVGVVGGLVGWCALNAAVVVALHHAPWKSLLAVAGLHLAAAVVAWLRARSLLGRPFFAMTRRELARDSRNLLEIVS